jgi:predicted esterase
MKRFPDWIVFTALIIGVYLMLLGLKPLRIDRTKPSQNRLRVLESAEQHVYARLSQAVRFQSKALPKGFVIDRALSTDQHAVFVSDRELVVGFRSTVDLEDNIVNAHIVIGQEQATERFQRSEVLARDARLRHPDPPRFTLVGFSLGGGIALHVALTLGVSSHTFNPALGVAALARLRDVPVDAPQLVYHTPLDPVSAAAVRLARLGRLPVTVVTVQNAPDKDPHEITNFYDVDAVPQLDGRLLVEKETIQETLRRQTLSLRLVREVAKMAPIP